MNINLPTTESEVAVYGKNFKSSTMCTLCFHY